MMSLHQKTSLIAILCFFEAVCLLPKKAHGQADPFAKATVDSARGTDQSQRQPNQAASVSLDDSADKNRQSGQVHAIPAAVCAAACLNGSMSGSSCSLASMGASVAAMAIQKNFQQNMAQSMASIQSLKQIQEGDQTPAEEAYRVKNGVFRRSDGAKPTEAMKKNPRTSTTEASSSNSGTNPDVQKKASSQQAKAPKKKKRNSEACVAAAVASLSAASALSSAKNADQQSEEISDELAGLKSNAIIANGLAKKGAKANSGASFGGAGNPQSVAAMARSCSLVNRKANPDAYIRCVRGFDPTIPTSLNTPQFKKDFKDLTGMELGDFLGQIPPKASPSDVMGSILGGNKNLGSPEDVKEKIAALEESIYQSNRLGSSSTYAGSGGGSRNNNEGDNFGEQMGNLMGNLMGSLAGGKKEKQNMARVNELRFGSRSTSSINSIRDASDVTIFEQITSRYIETRHRLSRLPWSAKINQRAPQQIR